jgi:hypothetical protein
VDAWAGVHGIASGHGSAGLFDGDVQIHGNLRVSQTVTKGGGTFQIDHPLDPENKYLTHSFVESPEMKNMYDGVGLADAAGEICVDVPSYFDALNADVRYQLTAIGAPAPGLHVKQELTGGRFVIAGAQGGQKVCWQITGNRKDPWALANPVIVERDKPDAEKGYYLHPEAFGLPAFMSIEKRGRNADVQEHHMGRGLGDCRAIRCDDVK